MDSFASAGAERKAAFAAAETASSHLRFAAPTFSLEIEKAAANEEARRVRTQVEVPRLSPPATAALDGLAKIKDVAMFDAAVKALPEAIKTELRTFETTLSKRLGPNVAVGDRAALASVPKLHRTSCEAAPETLKTVSRAVATDRQRRVAQERLMKSQKLSEQITW